MRRLHDIIQNYILKLENVDLETTPTGQKLHLKFSADGAKITNRINCVQGTICPIKPRSDLAGVDLRGSPDDEVIAYFYKGNNITFFSY